MRELRVGYVYDNYSVRRNVIGAAPYCRYLQTGDWYRTLARAGRLANRCLGREAFDVHDLAHRFHERRVHRSVDLLHLFNQVSYGTLPWLSTFETVLPRLRTLLDAHHGSRPSYEAAVCDPAVQRALVALAAPACRGLLAMSRCAAALQGVLVAAAQRRLHGVEAIVPKVRVVSPPQPALIAGLDAKPPLAGRRLRLLFVGGKFFRKGGAELIESLLALRRERHTALELTIVSSLTLDAGPAGETAADAQRMRAIFAANRDWIRHYETLDNAAVLELMRRSDVGLLPTYADTYGFVVLEFQAAGCPVISTDVRALPEINGEQRGGWLIDVPKNRHGEALYGGTAERERLSAAIRAGLMRCLRQLLDASPEALRARGEQALGGVRGEHDPARIGERLFDLYLDCAAARSSGTPASWSISS